MEGTVYKSTGSWYILKDSSGTFRNARIKGKLKIDEEISSTNPVAVGDVVLFDKEEGDHEQGIITQIRERNNYIIRVSPHNKNQKHIVAANLDLALVIATIRQPRTSMGFIDRFLITAEAYHIPAIVVINKIDVLKEKDQDTLSRWQNIYQSAGYLVFPVTAFQPDTIVPLREMLQGKKTLFSGHSGVGKSTLINKLIPGIALRTTEVSDWSGKGQHTTTFAEMFDLPGSGAIIDTPGVKEFGITGLEKEELSHYFPEMKKLLPECRFNNCMHINEPGCAVKAAVIDGQVSEERYISYRGILDSIEEKW